MRESGKAASIVSAAVALLSSAVVMPSLAAIFNEGWDDHYGQHQTYAWAYLSAWYNTRTRTWYGISHDHDWDGGDHTIMPTFLLTATMPMIPSLKLTFTTAQMT
jgi:hypothetical protein